MSDAGTLARGIVEGRQRVAGGERPVYHVTWAFASIGAIDVRVVELPIIHLFVPDPASVLDGGRLLIALTLGTDPASFDVAPETTPDPDPGVARSAFGGSR